MIAATEVLFNSIKKGNNAGTTLFAQSINPDLAADRFSLEKRTRQMVKRTNKIENMFFRREKVKN